MEKVSCGTKVIDERLGTEYWQHRMGTLFCGIQFGDNFVAHSLEDVFQRAMNVALNAHSKGDRRFHPVAQAKFDGKYAGCIGMMRYCEGRFEFSYFETGNRDRDIFRTMRYDREMLAIQDMNDNLQKDAYYPYYNNLTLVEYSGHGEPGSFERFAKVVLTFINAFSQVSLVELPSQSQPHCISTVVIAHDENSNAECLYATFTNDQRYHIDELLHKALKHQGATMSLRTINIA